MGAAVKKQPDVTRLMADLAGAKVELLSAQCATDRIRMRYSATDIATFGEPQTLQRLIASAMAVHEFFCQVRAQLEQRESQSTDQG